MANITLTKEGLLDPKNLKTFFKEKTFAVKSAVAEGMKEGGKQIVPLLQSHIQSRLKIKKGKFLKSFKARVFNSFGPRLPEMSIGTRLQFVTSHELGATLTGKNGKGLLIPLSKKRIPRKKFKELVKDLIETKEAHFAQHKGKTYLFQDYKLASGKRKSKAIAILLPQIRLKKRTDIKGTVLKNVDIIAREIESRL